MRNRTALQVCDDARQVLVGRAVEGQRGGDDRRDEQAVDADRAFEQAVDAEGVVPPVHEPAGEEAARAQGPPCRP